MEVEKFLQLVHGLTGTPVKPLKANERDALARALRDDGRHLDCSQLNELLLLVNKDRLESPFFDYFFAPELTIALLPMRVEYFQRVAMLCNGNFVYSYRTLSRASTPEELRKLLGGVCRVPAELRDSFSRRSPKLLEIDPISRDQTFLIGYLSARQIIDDNVYAELLLAAAHEALAQGSASWDVFEKRVAEVCKERQRAHVLSVIERYRKANIGAGVQELASVLEKENLPRLQKRLAELNEAQRRATDNQDIYLTWDHMDVYFATSMRKRWEFEDLFDFVSGLMSRPELAELNLRYFDPTQSFTSSRVNKGLVEALMLKRAKCTVYSVQDTDTLGKDSELAATLAQGKPVIAYVPTINAEERCRQLSQEDPTTIQERLNFLAYADSTFASALSSRDLAFVRGFNALEQFQQIWHSDPDLTTRRTVSSRACPRYLAPVEHSRRIGKTPVR